MKISNPVSNVRFPGEQKPCCGSIPDDYLKKNNFIEHKKKLKKAVIEYWKEARDNNQYELIRTRDSSNQMSRETAPL